jgi:geranylgeranyl diphosphate synthase type I
MAFELLARTTAAADVLRGVVELCARELSAVGIAQMQDVTWGASKSAVGVDDILRMYTHKTGRYSFTLPLLAGAMIANAPSDLCANLGTLGESVGLLFQIRDDELGLFGDPGELGKPVGSDVREGKKTLIVSSLMAAAEPEERSRLDGILGNPRAAPGDIDYVRRLASSAAARARIAAVTTSLTARAAAAIDSIASGADEDRAALRSLLDFTTARRQ